MSPLATSNHRFSAALALGAMALSSVAMPASASADARRAGAVSAEAATRIGRANDTAGPAACVETMQVSAPVFAAPRPSRDDHPPVRWCESPDSPECQGNDDHPATGLELGRDSGAMHQLEVEALRPPRSRTLRTLPTVDGEPRTEHGLGLDRPPSR